jgi:hypothetical protein
MLTEFQQLDYTQNTIDTLHTAAYVDKTGHASWC